MGLFFGTDGFRGVFGKELTFEVAYKCGRALAMQKLNAKILIGRDSRRSGAFLTLAFSLGVMVQGGSVEDIGICPTAGIGYLTTIEDYDYGVVISASHNQAEYNGIKIFNSDGKKITSEQELEIEKLFLIKEQQVDNINIGQYKQCLDKIKIYEKFLKNNKKSLKGLKIVIDCANGASSFIAKNVFSELGANVLIINDNPNGININKNCGALYCDELIKEVLNQNADMGFAFDGDSDRVICVDESGNLIDGDKLLYLFAIYYKKNNKLNGDCVVTTKLMNLGVEKALINEGISVIKTDVGDKNIFCKLQQKNLVVGGEQCGHILLLDELITGDGILNAILISGICVNEQKKLSEFFNFKISS